MPVALEGCKGTQSDRPVLAAWAVRPCSGETGALLGHPLRRILGQMQTEMDVSKNT